VCEKLNHANTNGVEHHDTGGPRSTSGGPRSATVGPRSDTGGPRSSNCRNRAPSSSLTSCREEDRRSETASLLRGHLPAAAASDDDEDVDNDRAAAQTAVPCTCGDGSGGGVGVGDGGGGDGDGDGDSGVRGGGPAVPCTCGGDGSSGDDGDPPQRSPSVAAPAASPSNHLRTRWTSLKRWFTPGAGTPTPAIGLDELRAGHVRLPVRTDVNHPCR